MQQALLFRCLGIGCVAAATVLVCTATAHADVIEIKFRGADFLVTSDTISTGTTDGELAYDPLSEIDILVNDTVVKTFRTTDGDSLEVAFSTTGFTSVPSSLPELDITEAGIFATDVPSELSLRINDHQLVIEMPWAFWQNHPVGRVLNTATFNVPLQSRVSYVASPASLGELTFEERDRVHFAIGGTNWATDSGGYRLSNGGGRILFETIPEPASIAILSLGGIAALTRRRA